MSAEFYYALYRAARLEQQDGIYWMWTDLPLADDRVSKCAFCYDQLRKRDHTMHPRGSNIAIHKACFTTTMHRIWQLSPHVQYTWGMSAMRLSHLLPRELCLLIANFARRLHPSRADLMLFAATYPNRN